MAKKTEQRRVITRYQGDASSLTKTLKSIDRGASQTAKGMARLNKTMGQAQNLFGGLFVGAGIGRAAQEFQALVTAVSQVQQMDNMLRGATKTNEEFAQSLDYIREISEEFGLSQESITAGYAKMVSAGKGAGFSLQQIEEQFRGIATAAAAFGLSASEVEGVVLGWQQTMGNATVNMEDLRQVVDRLPGGMNLAVEAFKTMSGQTELTAGEFKKMVSDGEVLTKDFLPALANQLEVAFSDAAVANADSYVAAISRLNNSFTELKRAIAESGLLDFVAQLTGDFADAVTVIRAMVVEGKSMSDAYAEIGLAEAIDDSGEFRDAIKQSEQRIKTMTDELERLQGSSGNTAVAITAVTAAIERENVTLASAQSNLQAYQQEFVRARQAAAELATSTDAVTQSVTAQSAAMKEAQATMERINEIRGDGLLGAQQLSGDSDLGDVALNMRDIAGAMQEGKFGEAQEEINSSADALERMAKSSTGLDLENIKRVADQLASYQKELTGSLGGKGKKENPIIQEMKEASEYAEKNPIPWEVTLKMQDALEHVSDQTGYRQ